MTTNEAIALAIQALEAVEWIGGHDGHSAVCLWCRGYEMHPAMDQDYYGKAGHKPECLRQRALAALAEEATKTSDERHD
jgi:hypothetical protein